MTQEFHLSVTPVGAETFLVRTERTIDGVPLGELQVTWPIATWIQQAQQALADPISHWHTPSTAVASDLSSLGQTLFNALFIGQIRDSWMAAQSIAQHRRERLRLRLGLAGLQLQQLPWEVLHDSDRPLGTRTNVVFSRYALNRTLNARSPLPVRQPGAPLRILMVIATPRDRQQLELLQREFRDMQQELASPDGFAPDSRLPMQITLLDQPDRSQLTQALEQGRYDVMHYAGHSETGSAGGSLELVNAQTGLTERLSGDDLAGLLANNGVQMAVLNSCRGAYQNPELAKADGAQNLAQALLRRGVPAVLAMAEHIPDEVALVLSRLFYRNLKQGYAIDLSLSRARQGLVSTYGSDQSYWALPVLYLHPEFDGRLGTLPTAPDVVRPLSGAGVNLSPSTPWLDSSPQALMPNHPAFMANDVTATRATNGLDLSDWDQPPLHESLDYWQRLATTTDAIVGATGDPTSPASAGMPVAPSPTSEPPFAQSTPIPLGTQASAQSGDRLDPALAQPLDQIMVDLAPTCEPTIQPDPAVTRLIHQLSTPGQSPPSCPPSTSSIPASAPPPSTVVPQGVTVDGLVAPPPTPNRAIPSPTRPPVPISPATPPSVPGTKRPPTPGAQARQVYRRRQNQIKRFGVAIAGFALVLGVGSVLGRLVHGTPELATDLAAPLPELPELNAPVLPDLPLADGQLNTQSDQAVTELALASIGKRDVPMIVQAIATLLDRNAIDSANQVLAELPAEIQAEAPILFLRGRVAWQQVRMGHPDYTVMDAQQFWQAAVAADPAVPIYHTALGFAHYANADYGQATAQWLETLATLQAQRGVALKANPMDADQVISTALVEHPDALNAYAGLSIASSQLASNQPDSVRQQMVSQARELCDTVFNYAPTSFTPTSLAENWLWSETAIADWQSLPERLNIIASMDTAPQFDVQ